MGRLSDILDKANEGNFDIPFKESLTSDELSLMLNNSNVVHYKKKEIVFRQSIRTSHIMYIKSGIIKIYKEGRNDKFLILKLEKSGNYLGLMSIFGSDIHQYSASSVDDSEIVYIDINIFKQILAKNGRFATKVINYLSQYGLFIFDRLMSQSQKQLPGRIADVLLYLSQDIYEDIKFTFPFTRRELAQLAGTTKESFIRTLAEFKHDKIIKLEGSEVEIVSMNIVKTLSQLG